MKKVISVCIAALLLALALTACGGNKKALSASDVQAKAEGLGYEFVDTTEDNSEIDYVEGSYGVCKGDLDSDHWFVMFAVTTSTQDAADVYQGNVDDFSNGLTTSSIKTSGNNYATYCADKDGQYKYAAFVDNTLLIAEVDLEYKDEVKALIEAMGY